MVCYDKVYLLPYYREDNMNPSQYSYAELFFHVVDSCCDENGGSYFLAVCLLCGKRIKPFNNCKTNTKWAKLRGGLLINHLVTKHNASLGQIQSCFIQINDLRMENGKREVVPRLLAISFINEEMKIRVFVMKQ